MSSWRFISEDRVYGKKVPLYGDECNKIFLEARAENPEDIKERNVSSLKGHFKRLKQNGNKWLAACNEANGRKRSGMSQEDIEKEAHTIYEAGGSKFQYLIVINEVMCTHPKWELKLDHDSIRYRPEDEESNEESGGSSKRTMISEDSEYSIPFNPEALSCGCSTIACPIGRDKAKNKRKGKISKFSTTSEVAAEIRALRLTRDNEIEVMNKLKNARIELEHKKLQRIQMKMKELMLNTLLAKEQLPLEDEEMKYSIMRIVFRE